LNREFSFENDFSGVTGLGVRFVNAGRFFGPVGAEAGVANWEFDSFGKANDGVAELERSLDALVITLEVCWTGVKLIPGDAWVRDSTAGFGVGRLENNGVGVDSDSDAEGSPKRGADFSGSDEDGTENWNNPVLVCLTGSAGCSSFTTSGVVEVEAGKLKRGLAGAEIDGEEAPKMKGELVPEDEAIGPAVDAPKVKVELGTEAEVEGWVDGIPNWNAGSSALVTVGIGVLAVNGLGVEVPLGVGLNGLKGVGVDWNANGFGDPNATCGLGAVPNALEGGCWAGDWPNGLKPPKAPDPEVDPKTGCWLRPRSSVAGGNGEFPSFEAKDWELYKGNDWSIWLCAFACLSVKPDATATSVRCFLLDSTRRLDIRCGRGGEGSSKVPATDWSMR
jgi:hypothetical protein